MEWSALGIGGIVGSELGSQTQKKHLQGYIQFKQKTRPFSLGLPKTVHWEAARGSPQQNFNYCSKEGNVIAKWGTMAKLEPEEPIRLITDLLPWQQEILDIVTEPPDDRSIYWIWERTGNVGKSAMSKLLCASHGALICAGKAADMKYMVAQAKPKPKIVIFDVPRSSLQYVSYTGIEEIKNGCFASSKYESGMVIMNSPHVLVFANELPDAAAMSADRWRVGSIQSRDEPILWSRT